MENDVTVNNQQDVKVIAIKLPFDLQERMLTFPFLHAIRECYPEAEIHFITPKIAIEVLNLLPFKAYYHEFDEDEIRSIFDVHRFSANAKIYNVDLFISLTSSFVDACLGLGLRAKKRLGFSDGWKTLVLNQKTSRPQNHHLCEDFFALYKVHVGEEVSTKLKVMSRELTAIVQDWDKLPYIAINLSPLKDAQIAESWLDLINRFENQRIILFASEDQNKLQLHMPTFMAKLSKKNLYTNFIYTSYIDLGKMLAFSRGVITQSGPAASISAYVGSRALILYDRDDPQRTGPFYFLSDTMIMSLRYQDNVVMSPRKDFEMEDVAKKAFDFFRLSIQ